MRLERSQQLQYMERDTAQPVMIFLTRHLFTYSAPLASRFSSYCLVMCWKRYDIICFSAAWLFWRQCLENFAWVNGMCSVSCKGLVLAIEVEILYTELQILNRTSSACLRALQTIFDGSSQKSSWTKSFPTRKNSKKLCVSHCVNMLLLHIIPRLKIAISRKPMIFEKWLL